MTKTIQVNLMVFFVLYLKIINFEPINTKKK